MSNDKNVGNYVLHRIMRCASGDYRGELAIMRRGFGKPYNSASDEVNVKCFVGMQPSMLGRHGAISKEQNAIYIALTSFARHQQGYDIKSNLMHEKKAAFGEAVAKLVDGDECSNSMVTKEKMLHRLASSCNMQEFAERLKPFIQLFNQKGIKLDYYDLANDIYYFQFENGKINVQLKWATDFARGMYEKVSYKNNSDLNNVA